MILTHDIPNLHRVDDIVWRGGQPASADAWAYLSSLGVTHVIKLNTEPENCAMPCHMAIHKFPITTSEQIVGPVGPQLESAYDCLTAVLDDDLTVYAHCEHGANRTGALVILYRIRVCGWSKFRAYVEAWRYGWWSTLPALRAYIAEQ